MSLGFDYKDWSDFEKTIGPVEEQIIKAQFKTVVEGNSSFDGQSSAQMEDAYWLFRHGWVCCRMFLHEGERHDV